MEQKQRPTPQQIRDSIKPKETKEKIDWLQEIQIIVDLLEKHPRNVEGSEFRTVINLANQVLFIASIIRNRL